MSQRVALITGASGGLGSVVTPMFLESGYAVSAVALDWPAAGSSDAIDDRWHAQTADLTSPAAAQAVASRTRETLGEIDCLVHLVGAFEGGGRVEETEDEVWDRMLAVNLRAAVNMVRAVVPGMRARGAGRIVVVGSTSATEPVVTWSAFCAAVAGLCSFVQVAAAELRDHGVTVNAVLPTTIDTPVVREWCGDADAPKWVRPRAIGELMLWLCSDAGADVTGALIPMQGRQPHPCRHWHGETDAG
jgi:NAD(P)-dependent dehydrogenase (short-subunit alcohol dehydrogenase family)